MNRTGAGLTRYGAALLVFACCGCSNGATPAAPSAAPIVSVSGSYALTLTRCGLPAEGPSERPMAFACSSQNKWTLSQDGSDVKGTAVSPLQCAPFNWKGDLTGTVTKDGIIQITTLTYRDSSSHSTIQTLALSGSGVIDDAGFAGMFSGAYTSADVFGSATGPVDSCLGTLMPFRFSRQQ
jgi:hypothetical protein